MNRFAIAAIAVCAAFFHQSAAAANAAPVESIEPGLKAELFKLLTPPAAQPNIEGLAVAQSWVDLNVNGEAGGGQWPNTDASTNYYIRWTGIIRIPKDGKYSFFTISDDGSRLLINGQQVVDNGGLHGMIEKSGEIQLRAGDAEIFVDMYQGGGGAGCKALWAGEGIEKGVIPPTVLFHKDVQDPRAAEKKEALAEVAKDYPEYKGYRPSFVNLLATGNMGWPQGWVSPSDVDNMKRSFEKTFFTLSDGGSSMLETADDYVTKATQFFVEGNTRKALETYLALFDNVLQRNPTDILYRVSEYGVFVPMRDFCQRRMLHLPSIDLEHYRKLKDSSAQEAFEQALRQNSLAGLADVAGNMLATSFGDRAIVELGNAALDNGNFLEALEYYNTLISYFPSSKCRTADFELRVAYCKKMIGDQAATGQAKSSSLAAADLEKLNKIVAAATADAKNAGLKGASWPARASDDYAPFEPPKDPMALQEPNWKFSIPGARTAFFVFSQPVVTDKSLIYRNRNVIYCQSLLNGALRWKNDIGGIVGWQNQNECMNPEEDVLVKNGLVITPIMKVGPSLVALDEVTGQIRWAHGRLTASSGDEARMRFESAPAAGEKTVFAGYVLDNIEGETHINTEYGVMSIETSTGRVEWRTPLCTLAPGRLTSGFAQSRRNMIRSFSSPPLYHEGTVYYCTNAGVVTALDARSGRVKWYMRYPYHPEIHDARRPFMNGPEPCIHGGNYALRPDPCYWQNQRPLIIGDKLFVTPVDSSLLMCINRRDGREMWSYVHGSNGYKYFLGPISTGELVVVGNGRAGTVFGWGGGLPGAIHLIDQNTGKETWNSPDLIMKDDHPSMADYMYGMAGMGMNQRYFENAGRPFLDSADNLIVPNWTDISVYWMPGCEVYHLAQVNLKDRKIEKQRRYYTGESIAMAGLQIHEYAPKHLKIAQETHQDQFIDRLTAMSKDTGPTNEQGPFMPMERMTFSRFGTQFDLRFGPREVSMLYDETAVKQAVEKRTDPDALFAKAELALKADRLDEASDLLKKCLEVISSEDLDFRAQVNQQLFRVSEGLARRGLFRAKPDEELQSCLAMSRTATTMADEIETLFALADAYEHKGDLEAAARCLRNVIAVYGQNEYPISAIAGGSRDNAEKAAKDIMERTRGIVNPEFYPKEMNRSLSLLQKGSQLYFSTVSPLPKVLTVRAGEFAAKRLAGLLAKSPELAKSSETLAASELPKHAPEEQALRIWQFPASTTAQSVLGDLFKTTSARQDQQTCKDLLALADVARVCSLKVPDEFAARVLAPKTNFNNKAIGLPAKETAIDMAADAGPERLVLSRKDDCREHSNLIFVAARVKKKSDYKYTLACYDLADGGKEVWKSVEMRLGVALKESTGKIGDDSNRNVEWGFFDAFVDKNQVVVHGLYNVLSFSLEKAEKKEPKWKFDVPAEFSIQHAAFSGNVMVIAGSSETLALNLDTASGAGEVIWQEGESGIPYGAPYFVGDRLITVRQLPYNVTARSRATGKMIGRLEVPDLTLYDVHPLWDEGPKELPMAHDGTMLFLADQYFDYYIAVDVERMAIAWKRLIATRENQIDKTKAQKLRFFAGGKYFGVLKEDFVDKAFHMFNAQTGDLLWATNVKDPNTALPSYSVVIDGEKMYGLAAHPGQGYILTGYECATGKALWAPVNQDAFQSKPNVFLHAHVYEKHLVAQIADQKNFEMRVYDVTSGQLVHKLAKKGEGLYGMHGGVSGIVQDGKLALLTPDALTLSLP